MDLTPEERTRIYGEEKARLEADQASANKASRAASDSRGFDASQTRPCPSCARMLAAGVETCPYCGSPTDDAMAERLRARRDHARAVSSVKPPSESANALLGCIGCLIFPALLLWVIIMYNANAPSGPPRAMDASEMAADNHPGQTVTLSARDGHGVALFREISGFQAAGKAGRAGDDVGFKEAVSSGGFAVADGTRALVLDTNAGEGATQVRIKGGDHDGEAGWALASQVQK